MSRVQSSRSSNQPGLAKKRHAPFKIPAESLLEAERLAAARKVNLKTVVTEALAEGLRLHASAERANEVMNAYKRALSGFSVQDSAILDGIILLPKTKLT